MNCYTGKKRKYYWTGYNRSSVLLKPNFTCVIVFPVEETLENVLKVVKSNVKKVIYAPVIDHYLTRSEWDKLKKAYKTLEEKDREIVCMCNMGFHRSRICAMSFALWDGEDVRRVLEEFRIWEMTSRILESFIKEFHLDKFFTNINRSTIL